MSKTKKSTTFKVRRIANRNPRHARNFHRFHKRVAQFAAGFLLFVFVIGGVVTFSWQAEKLQSSLAGEDYGNYAQDFWAGQENNNDESNPETVKPVNLDLGSVGNNLLNFGIDTGTGALAGALINGKDGAKQGALIGGGLSVVNQLTGGSGIVGGVLNGSNGLAQNGILGGLTGGIGGILGTVTKTLVGSGKDECGGSGGLLGGISSAIGNLTKPILGEGSSLNLNAGGFKIGVGGGCNAEAALDGPGAAAGLESFKGYYKGNKYGSAIGMITGWTNFILPFVSVLAIAALVYAGFLYITAFGNQEQTGKAKKIILWVALGIILILSAYAIVNTLLSGDAST